VNRLLLLFSRLGFAWARRRLDGDARREFDTHLDLLTERFVERGMPLADARAAARRQLGNPTLVREEIHRMNGLAWWDGLLQDLRYAVRQIRHGPGFAAVVVVTLGLGIGGTTAMFSVVHAILLAPLPYDQPGLLVRFYQQEPDKPDTRGVLTGAHFSDLREHSSSFENVAAIANYSETGLDLVREGRGQRLRVLRVSSGYFATLRSGSVNGPGFDRSDETGTKRVVLSDALWRTGFGGGASLVGTTIRLSAESYEVAGIASPRVDDPIAGQVDAWLPYNLARDTNEENNSLSAVGRLRKGVSLEQARAELLSTSRGMKERFPAARLSAVAAVPLQDDLVAPAREPLGLLSIAVGLVLLVACVNVANLMLVRSTGRAHEFAVRSALGSGRRRIVRQLLVESLMFALLGGLAGIVFARLGLDVLTGMGQGALPRFDEVGFHPAALAFAGVATIATAVAFGMAPAFRVARVSPSQAMRQQSRSATGSRGQQRLRGALAAAQLALALTLLVGAGVLVATVQRLQQVDLGFRIDRVLTFEVNLPTVRYPAPRRAEVQEAIAREIRKIPGVTAAGAISRLPGTGSYHGWNTSIRTGPLAGTSVRRADGFNMQQRVVSGDAFAALGLPVLTGRAFDERDDLNAAPRVVVSASFARRAFPALAFDGAIGQRIAAGGQELDIIGVVGDVVLDVYGAPALVVYHAHRQFADDRNWALSHVIAGSLPPERLLPAIRDAVTRLDPELVVHRASSMADVVRRGTNRERFALVLMGAFAGAALLLATIGLYGVLTHTVRQRTQEIGIRLALGATTTQVRALVLRQAALVLAVGLAVGIGGALALGRWLSSLAFQVSPSDPRLILATALVLTVTGLVSAWLPARRASRIDPRTAMREG
jgi:predicted permease